MDIEARSVILIRPVATNTQTHLIYQQLVPALEARARILGRDFVTMTSLDFSNKLNFPTLPEGLSAIKTGHSVITLGLHDFIALSSIEKKAVIAGEQIFLMEHQHGVENKKRAKQLLWSGLNTSEIICLDMSSWKALQIFPLSQRSYRNCPPIPIWRHLPVSALRDNGSILLINHSADKILFQTISKSVSSIFDNPAQLSEMSKSEAANCDEIILNNISSIHLHIGAPDKNATCFRVQDSWASSRAVVCLSTPSTASAPLNSFDIEIRDGVNALVARDVTQLANVLRLLKSDKNLIRALVKSGSRSISGIETTWTKIAEDLV